MSEYAQLTGILSARNELDDQYNSKNLFKYNKLQGLLDGTNTIFQIPQQRIVVYSDSVMNLFPQVYQNDAPLVFDTDYELLDALSGKLEFTVAPQPTDTLSVDFNWVWLTDIEWDLHLFRAAGEIGLNCYYTETSNIPGTQPIPANGDVPGVPPSDIPDALFGAICVMAASLAARALALRFSTRYDTSAGDQSFSPSQMAKSFGDLSDKLEKRAYNMRDDFYKGHGRQYSPSTAQQGYILPNWTPAR
jgi:hypothetical protein